MSPAPACPQACVQPRVLALRPTLRACCFVQYPVASICVQFVVLSCACLAWYLQLRPTIMFPTASHLCVHWHPKPSFPYRLPNACADADSETVPVALDLM